MNYKNNILFSRTPLSSRLSICLYIPDVDILNSLTKLLSEEKYSLHQLSSAQHLSTFVPEHQEELDCLIISRSSENVGIITEFYEQEVMLPVIIIDQSDSNIANISEDKSTIVTHDATTNIETKDQLYHSAEIRIETSQVDRISKFIDKAISQFLHLAPSCSLVDKVREQTPKSKAQEKQSFLLLQQKRLAEKLKERLGYLGVYYQRNPNHFYRNLTSSEQEEFILDISEKYREIILDYFDSQIEVNQAIDNFVNQAFFADLSVSQILEIHMDLMDDFSQQLKLEGRNEDILLDYRLALIDLIAHLCEMYRRSIPKEDIPFDMLFQVD